MSKEIEYSVVKGSTAWGAKYKPLADAISALSDDECVHIKRKISDNEVMTIRTMVREIAGLRTKFRRTITDTFIWRGAVVGSDEDKQSASVLAGKNRYATTEKEKVLGSMATREWVESVPTHKSDTN